MNKSKERPVKVLVVEDDADILNVLNIVLGSEGFDVEVLRQGECILKNQFVKPEVFILDYRLPDPDGLQICRYLKGSANYKSVPVILISASPNLKKKAIDAGADIFIEKPFQLREIVDAVNNVLSVQKS